MWIHEDPDLIAEAMTDELLRAWLDVSRLRKSAGLGDGAKVAAQALADMTRARQSAMATARQVAARSGPPVILACEHCAASVAKNAETPHPGG